jgi:SNF family Na+-dependent transporter
MGLEPTEGPSLVFSVLPAVFVGMPFGNLVSIIFFTLLAIAAITSGISLLEVVVAYFIDQRKWDRKKAVLVTSATIFAFGVPSGLSFGVLSEAKLFDMNFFDHVDNIASNYLLPLGGMLTAIFVGWVWGTQSAEEEIEKYLPYLKSHIEIINPKILLLLGSTALNTLIGSDVVISKARGVWIQKDIGTAKPWIIASFHPAFLMRQPEQKKLAWIDLKMIRDKFKILKL